MGASRLIAQLLPPVMQSSCRAVCTEADGTSQSLGMQVKLVAASLRELPPSQEKKLSYKQGVFSAECHRGLGGDAPCAESLHCYSFCRRPPSVPVLWRRRSGPDGREKSFRCAEHDVAALTVYRCSFCQCQEQWPKTRNQEVSSDCCRRPRPAQSYKRGR